MGTEWGLRKEASLDGLANGTGVRVVRPQPVALDVGEEGRAPPRRRRRRPRAPAAVEGGGGEGRRRRDGLLVGGQEEHPASASGP